MHFSHRIWAHSSLVLRPSSKNLGLRRQSTRLSGRLLESELAGSFNIYHSHVVITSWKTEENHLFNSTYGHSQISGHVLFKNRWHLRWKKLRFFFKYRGTFSKFPQDFPRLFMLHSQLLKSLTFSRKGQQSWRLCGNLVDVVSSDVRVF